MGKGTGTNAVLNFSGKDKQLILAFLKKQKQDALRNEFEEAKK